jgi:hypothetical protein
MTNLAYLVFTFVACVLGLGLGLLIHHFGKFLRRTPEDFASIASGEEEATYEKLSNWQAENNKRFAMHISGCAAVPLIFAAAGYENRSDVVGAICHSIAQVAGQSALCF